MSDIDLKSLSFGMVRQIEDRDLLEHIREQLDVDIEHIKAALEYSTEDQTVDWEKRATFALANKKALRHAVIRRLDIDAFKDRHSVAQSAIIDSLKAKIAKMEEDRAGANQRNALEIQRLSVEKQRVKNELQCRRDTHFAQLAARFLTPEQRIICGAEAERLADVAIAVSSIAEAAE